MLRVSKATRNDKKRGAIVDNFESQPFTYAAAILAIVASIGLGVAGVWRMAGASVETGNAIGVLGTAIAVAGIAVCEMTAAVALLHADRRAAQGAETRKWVARVIFAAAITANMLAGHQGAGAVSDALVGPQREPFEVALATARATEAAADDAVSHFDEQTRDILAAFDDDLRGTRESAAMAVTARRGTLGDRATAAADREQLRSRPCESAHCTDGGVLARQARARAETAAAVAALGNAPKPMTDQMQWALALMFELVKSVLLWVATPRQARATLPVAKLSQRPVPPTPEREAPGKVNDGGWAVRRERYGVTGRKPKHGASALSAARA